jgi:hypothetical protein
VARELVVLVDKGLDEVAPRLRPDLWNAVMYPVGPLQVPLQLTPRRRMRELDQGAIDLAERASEAEEKIRRMWIESSEQGGGQISDKANKVSQAARAVNWSDLVAGFRGEDTWNVDIGDSCGDMLHRCVLKLKDVEVFSGVPDLEDKLLAPVISQVKILISFAWQFCGRGFNSVQVGGQGRGLLPGKLGSFGGASSHSFSR